MELNSEEFLEYLKNIEPKHLPTWCNTDLRDVNKALMEPLKCEEMVRFYDMLYSLGVREMAVGDIMQPEICAFLKNMVERTLIRKDVTFVVEVPRDAEKFQLCLPMLKALPNVVLDLVDIRNITLEELEIYRGFDLSFKLVTFEEEICHNTEKCSRIAEAFSENTVFYCLPLNERNLPHIFGARINEFKRGLPPNAEVGLFQFNRRMHSPYHGEYAYIGGVTKFKGSFFVNDDLRKQIQHFEDRGLDSGLNFINLPEKDIFYEKLAGQKSIRYLLETQCGLVLPSQMEMEVEAYIKEKYQKSNEPLTIEWVYRVFEAGYVINRNVFSCEDITYTEENGCIADLNLVLSDEIQHITGSGSGRLEAVSNAIQQYFGISFHLGHYEGHSLSMGFSSKVLCTVGVSYDGKTYWGAGINVDLMEASIDALSVAVNSIPQVREGHSGKDKRMIDILNYIEKNYEEVTLKSLAAHFFLSEPYLSKYIRDHSGSTFGEIVKKIRMKKARNMLKNSTMTVERISKRVGYKNVEHFNRLFKKLYDMTPTQYRNMG